MFRGKPSVQSHKKAASSCKARLKYANMKMEASEENKKILVSELPARQKTLAMNLWEEQGGN